MKRLLLSLGLFAAAMPAYALDYSQFSLKNGMDVYVIEDHRAPVAINFVWYKTGAGDEKDGQTGIAHMLEHLMFKGTENIPPQEFSKIVARNGGQDNAFTSYDYTAYYQKSAVENLEKMMSLEADRMQGLTFTDTEFLPERDVVMEERRWRVDSKPVNRFYEALAHVHMPMHPYGRPVIGWKQDIEGYTSQMARDWYTRWYQPNNASLIVIGDVTQQQVKDLVANTYAKVPSTKQIDHDNWPVEPLFTEAKRFEKVDAEVKASRFVRMYRAPSIFAGIAGNPVVNGHKTGLELSLLAQVLGGSDTSPLYKALVEDKKLAVNASMSYSGIARGESSVDFSAQATDGVTLSAVEAEVEAVINTFIKEGVTQAELERAKTAFKSAAIYAQDDLFYSAYRLGRWLVAGGTADNFNQWEEDIKHITVADLQQVAKKYLTGHQHTTGYLANTKDKF